MRYNILTKSSLLLFVMGVFFSCRKNVDCDNAQLCVKNVGTGTILYGWNTNSYTDSLKPGQSACIYVGEIEISSSSESVKWVDFMSSRGNYRIKVDNCLVEKEVE